MPSLALRPRSGPELLDAAFHFWRENFALLFTVVAAAFLPVIALGAVEFALPRSFESRMLSRVATAIFESLAWAAVIVVVSERYIGHEITPSRAIGVVWARLWTIFVANVVFWILVYFGMILFIAPGLYFFAKYFAIVPVIVLEGHGVSAAQKRAAAISKGSRWRVLGLVGVPWLLYLFVFGGITSVVAQQASDITTVILTRLLIACVYPLLGILATLLYYDLRFRNEGLDLDMMMTDPPTQSAPA